MPKDKGANSPRFRISSARCRTACWQARSGFVWCGTSMGDRRRHSADHLDTVVFFKITAMLTIETSANGTPLLCARERTLDLDALGCAHRRTGLLLPTTRKEKILGSRRHAIRSIAWTRARGGPDCPRDAGARFGGRDILCGWAGMVVFTRGGGLLGWSQELSACWGLTRLAFSVELPLKPGGVPCYLRRRRRGELFNMGQDNGQTINRSKKR
jgi:hypothetical protein